MLDLKIENYQEAMQIIGQLPDKMQRKVFTPALRVSARPMLAAARQRVPKRTGKLAKMLRVVNSKVRNSAISEVLVKPVFNKHKSGEVNEYYGKMIHNGTAERRPKSKKMLRFKDPQSNEWIFTRKAAPIKATPFLLDAFNATVGQVETNFGNEVARSTEKFINTKFK